LFCNIFEIPIFKAVLRHQNAAAPTQRKILAAVVSMVEFRNIYSKYFWQTAVFKDCHDFCFESIEGGADSYSA
jgi:hypothetical protein